MGKPTGFIEIARHKAKYRPVTERLRDWLSNPKSNGYEALHTTVMGPQGKWVEVQIRTKRMNEIAEKGLAAHWKYKEGATDESRFDKWFSQIREVIIALPDMAFDESGIEESIRTVEAKARNEEELAEGLDLLRRAFEKTGQLPEAEEFLKD